MKQWKIYSDNVKHEVCRQVMAAEFGAIVTLDESSKSRSQESKYHAMFSAIANQCEFMGQKWTPDDWKRLLVDAFSRVMKEQGTPLSQHGRIVPALDGNGFVQLGIQTRKFRKREASEFIEYLMAFGAQNGVKWPANARDLEMFA